MSTTAKGIAIARGSVIRAVSAAVTQMPKAKFMIPLNAAHAPDPVHYVFTTSQIDKPRFQRADLQPFILLIPAGTYPFFWTDTIVDLSAFHQMSLETFTRQPRYEWVGVLSSEHLAFIDASLRGNTTIETRVKRQIGALPQL